MNRPPTEYRRFPSTTLRRSILSGNRARFEGTESCLSDQAPTGPFCLVSRVRIQHVHLKGGGLVAQRLTTGERHPDSTPDGRYKWVALSNTTVGVLLATIDSSIMLIAMPD